ncbi:MAG: hypothetical protein HY956_00175 [Deltaproteobacteria bacterium]|nr:hypothetical protein [Deltaproteobacteria bacterium]
MVSKRLRIFAAFFAGNIFFFFVFSLVLWLLTRYEISPYGRFVAAFFKGRKPEEAKAAIEANQALFDELLPEAVRFSDLFVMPAVGFLMGGIVGAIMRGRQWYAGAVWALIVAGPVSIFFLARSAGNEKFLHLAVFLALTAIGGVVGNAAANKAAGGAAKAE